ncbi:hypothetical protein SO802_017736 [Lithocarpus litseifolius]|uniref:MSP domain-containing protein n=1 Tax=Lithocarpus litseifolius TaxID=425828 RepID=A0AAW2CKW2_9ROSI
MVHASPQPEVPSPTPPSQTSFDLDIPFHLTPPMHLETPSYPPTSSSAPTLLLDPPRTEPMTMIPTPSLYTKYHYPPISSSSDPLGPPIRIDTVHPDTDVPNEHPPHQPSPPLGRPQRARRAPTCGTGGHKIGHKGSSVHNDEPKDDAPQPPPPPKQYTRVKKRKIDKLAHAVVSWTLAPHCFALDELDTCFAPFTKVKTTSPKKYCVLPNAGIIKPKMTFLVYTVTMQAQRAAPPDMQCKDKFLIQSTVIPFGSTEEDITSDMFAKDSGIYIVEKKLRVILTAPPPSPILLPINGVLKQDPSCEASMLKDIVRSGVENIPPPQRVDEDVKGIETAEEMDELRAVDFVDSRPADNVEELKVVKKDVELNLGF